MSVLYSWCPDEAPQGPCSLRRLIPNDDGTSPILQSSVEVIGPPQSLVFWLLRYLSGDLFLRSFCRFTSFPKVWSNDLATDILNDVYSDVYQMISARCRNAF